MAKNFVQHGKTIEIANTGSVEILSGSPVMVGKVVAIAITDIAAGQTGDGFTEGVFLLPKLTTDADLAGVAWEDAAASSAIVAVKINA